MKNLSLLGESFEKTSGAPKIGHLKKKITTATLSIRESLGV